MGRQEEHTIKRETWNTKQGKKFFTVARDEHGHVIARRGWNQKENSISKLNKQFEKTGTFDEHITRSPLRNVNEIVDISERPQVPTGSKFSYQVTGILKDGSTITARSRQEDKGFPLTVLRDEARTSFFERLSQKFLGEGHYDKDEGILIADRQVSGFKEGVVFYQSRAVPT